MLLLEFLSEKNAPKKHSEPAAYGICTIIFGSKFSVGAASPAASPKRMQGSNTGACALPAQLSREDRGLFGG